MHDQDQGIHLHLHLHLISSWVVSAFSSLLCFHTRTCSCSHLLQYSSLCCSLLFSDHRPHRHCLLQNCLVSLQPVDSNTHLLQSIIQNHSPSYKVGCFCSYNIIHHALHIPPSLVEELHLEASLITLHWGGEHFYCFSFKHYPHRIGHSPQWEAEQADCGWYRSHTQQKEHSVFHPWLHLSACALAPPFLNRDQPLAQGKVVSLQQGNDSNLHSGALVLAGFTSIGISFIHVSSKSSSWLYITLALKQRQYQHRQHSHPASILA